MYYKTGVCDYPLHHLSQTTIFREPLRILFLNHPPEQMLKGVVKSAVNGAIILSIAKKAVDSTIKRILVYTAEIVAAFILLVIICIPLIFTIPMWIQNVVFGSTSAEYLINPVAWFGMAGAVGITLLLAIPSLVLGYITVAKMGTGVDSDDEETPEADEPEIDESEEDSEPAEVESVEAEDTEDASDTSEQAE